MVEEVLGGLFAIAFGSFFLFAVLLSLVEIFGKIYGTYSCFVREDLTGEQRIIYLALIWFIPIGWLIYFLLGKERTSETFSDVDFL